MAGRIVPTPGVYVIRNTLNQHLYVGSSENIDRRIRAHKKLLERGCHHSLRLQRAWSAYGASAFEFKILELVESSRLIAREQHFIDALGAFGKHGYNMLPNAGSSRGSKRPPMSEAQRLKHSERMKSYRHTEESRRKISQANKGLKRSPEHCARMAEIMSGRKLSAETIAKRSAKIRGIKHPPYSAERRRNISEALKGKPSLKAIEVRLDGVTYRSITEAMTQLRCSYRTLKARIQKSA